MMNLVKRLWQEEEGQGLVEYALILALIAVVVIGVVTEIGDSAKNTFEDVKEALTT